VRRTLSAYGQRSAQKFVRVQLETLKGCRHSSISVPLRLYFLPVYGCGLTDVGFLFEVS
jgi:hypothetical protein